MKSALRHPCAADSTSGLQRASRWRKKDIFTMLVAAPLATLGPATHAQAAGEQLQAQPAAPGAAPACQVAMTRNFGNGCGAQVSDTIPDGANRTYLNFRTNLTGSVTATCISGTVFWSTGNCKTVASGETTSAADSIPSDRRPKGAEYRIGTFYFPGWRSNQVGAPAQEPWSRLKPYPEREPLLGWYDDGDVAVVNQQLTWMRTYGIDYVVFDWYWNGKSTELDHSIKAYLKAPARHDVPMALLWANHSAVPRTKLEFTAMVDFWIKEYFGRPEFMKIDGKPVIFLFSHPHFEKQARQIGGTYSSLLADAELRAQMAGHKGIYFVGGTHIDPSIIRTAESTGYSAFSTYNYHGRADDSSTSFEELDNAYQYVWGEILKQSAIPYIVPMTQGWDKRPWGGSKNPLHDNSGGDLQGFERHLAAARRAMDASPAKTMKTGVICCWNEFGEGSYIEPTKKDKFGFLERVQRVFGSP